MLRVLSFNAGVSLITKMRRGWGRGGRSNHHRRVYFKEKHRLLFRHLEPCSDRCRRLNRQGLQEPETADLSSQEGIRSQICFQFIIKIAELSCYTVQIWQLPPKMVPPPKWCCCWFWTSQGRIVSLMQMNRDTQDICAFLHTPVRASRAVCGLAWMNVGSEVATESLNEWFGSEVVTYISAS